jgi:hypothetical protein
MKRRKMTEMKLKNLISIMFVLMQALIIAAILAVHNCYDPSTIKALISTVSPVFSAFTVIMIKNIIENRNVLKDKSKKVNGLFVFFAVFICFALFFSTLFLILSTYFENLQLKNEDLFIYFGLVETTYAAYMGFFVKSLFPVEEKTGDEE